MVGTTGAALLLQSFQTWELELAGSGAFGVVVGAGLEDQSSHLVEDEGTMGLEEVVVGFGLLDELQSTHTD